MSSEATPLLPADSQRRRNYEGTAAASIRERRKSSPPNTAASSSQRHHHQHRRRSGHLRQRQQAAPPPSSSSSDRTAAGRPPPMSRDSGRGIRHPQQQTYSPPQSAAFDDSTDPSLHDDRRLPFGDRSAATAAGASSSSGGAAHSQQQQPHQPQHHQPRRHADADDYDYRGPNYNEGANRMAIAEGMGAGRPLPPLLDGAVPPEVLEVRTAALTVLGPLTLTWPIVSAGFALTIGLGLARWTDLLEELPYWAILLPSWSAHAGLLVCHVMSARALSAFIAEANDNRQRQDSTDHLDRTEYLPLLQRSLKFGLKTGALSLCTFVFEVLVYVHVAVGSMTLAAAMTPVWIVVVGGILDGIICKTQHALRVLCWVLLFASMVMLVLKVDHGLDVIRWRLVMSPVIALLSVSSASLIYVVYGHQVGYFRLSEAQLTAGILYSMAALLCIIFVVLAGEFIPYLASGEIETRLFVVGLGPIVMLLVGSGACAVSRDEFDRLLKYGGQAAVHPMRLRLEPGGWTAVEGKGVTNIPMFGEVAYEPLDKSRSQGIELCSCCACYPYEDDDEVVVQYQEPPPAVRQYYPSLAASSQSVRTGEAAIPPQGMQV